MIAYCVATVTSRRNSGHKIGFRTFLPSGLIQVRATQRLISIWNICCLDLGDRKPFTPKTQQGGKEGAVSNENWCVRSSVKLALARHGGTHLQSQSTGGLKQDEPTSDHIEGYSTLGTFDLNSSKPLLCEQIGSDAALPITWRRLSLRCRVSSKPIWVTQQDRF